MLVKTKVNLNLQQKGKNSHTFNTFLIFTENICVIYGFKNNSSVEKLM